MKVTIEVIQGSTAGKKYVYDGCNSIYLGRQSDCGIVFPEMTVSRYHCLLKISLNEVTLQDLGSSNGTYLNNIKIGHGDRKKSQVEADDDKNEEYILRNGDEIRLGKSCMLKCMIEIGELSKEDGTEPLNKASGKKNEDEQSLFIDKIIKQMRDDGLPEPIKSVESKLIARYKKEKLLGNGGMGEVWEVRDTETGRHFALKTMLPRIRTNEREIKIFLREANLSVALSHRNIVQTYKIECAKGVFYILMELCEGGSVENLMKKKEGMLSTELATWIILQVLSGLDYIHNVDLDIMIQDGLLYGGKEVSVTGIVHRDLKPSNILLSDDSDYPIAMIADFGMAKAFETSGISGYSRTGSKKGTPQFMSQQQAIDSKHSKPEVDVWAAAACYYYMLTGKYPKDFCQDENDWNIVVEKEAVPICNRGVSVPESLAEVIDRALDDSQGIVYTTASEFREDIISALPKELRISVEGVI